jgi:hypothetical protein
MSDLSPSPGIPRKHHLPSWSLALGLSFLLSLLLLIPFLFLGTASGHDFEFHAPSWMDVASQWKQGILYPRWAEWANHGFGEPRFVFYPPLSWILGAALTLAVPGPWVPVLFILLTQTFAGLAAFLLLRRLTSARAAILGAGCYVINPYALLITYLRSDFAEQLACALFPLLFLAALKLADLLEEVPAHRFSIALFAISFAGVWLSNAPAGVIASYAMALLFAWAAIAQRSWQVLFRGASGLALGLGLAGFYLVPAAYEQRWVNIGQALASGLLPSQNFLYTFIDDSEHTWVNWIASTCALLLAMLFLLGALASRRFSASGTTGNRSRKAAQTLLVVGAAAMFLMERLSMPLWNYLPKLRFIQFPWRWMSILALVCAFSLACTMERRRGWLAFVLVLALSLPLVLFLINNTWWDADEMPTLADAITSGVGFDGTDEYDPVGDDHMNLPLNVPLVKELPDTSDGAKNLPARVEVHEWTAERKQIRVEAAAETRLALRVLNYPAWRVEVNGKPVLPGRMDDVNQMVVSVQPGTSEIRVQFVRTADRTVGLLLTLCAALLVGILLFFAGARPAKESPLAPVD